MRNEIIYKGLRLVTNKCKYFQVKEGTTNSIVEDPITSVLTLTYSPGSSPKSLSESLGIPLIGSGGLKLTSMLSPQRFKTVTVSLNGLTLEKLTYDSHIINVVIVDDSESRVVKNYDSTIFVVSKDDYKNPDFINYLFYSGNLLYLRPVGTRICGYEIRNFPKILISTESKDLTSDNEVFYSLRRRYNDYLIREIDYQDQFIAELGRIFEDYGIEFTRQNRERTLLSTSYVTYQFNQTPTNYAPPMHGDIERNIVKHRQPIDFSLHTTDMVLYHDFKTKYNNVDLVTNFTQFTTPDKLGERYTAAVKWGPITEDFNHIYGQDDNSNYSLQCQFRCELFFYEVLDRRFEFIQEIVTRLGEQENT